MGFSAYIAIILGLALLMVVHEGGHLLVARAFKMRVIRFSIGFGPPLWRYQPKGADTVYQVALIPFLAYVQIAGMNPFEEQDPNDRGSYANASLTARVATVFAGPLANYLFASVLFFAALLIGGEPVATTKVSVTDDSRAAAGGMESGDKVVRIGKTRVESFEQMRQIVLENPNRPLEFVVLRGSEERPLTVTPKDEPGVGGLIGVRTIETNVPVSFRDAAVSAAVLPAQVLRVLVVGLVRIVTGKEKADLTGPIGIVKHGARSVHAGGMAGLLQFLGMLSAYLGGFNLLPVPALDGGRLVFLSYEAVARRKPNQTIEAHIHAVGLLMFLALMVVVSVFDIKR